MGASAQATGLHARGSLADASEQITIADAIRLGAQDHRFYCQYFFPKTCRQTPPDFHDDIWEDCLSDSRFVAFEVFRGGAKTTNVRLIMSYLIAYDIMRTGLAVGKSQESAAKTIMWLKRAVMFNALWAGAFGLRQGEKWTETEVEIWHGMDDRPIRCIALGITGSTRGINVDDYRPDFIFVDDPCDEENTATPEQREKTSNAFFGDLANSLAPHSEAPLAKLVLAQTPLNPEDLISQAKKDNSFRCRSFGCFDAHGESRWPARWSTAELLSLKQSYIDRGNLSVWSREMECNIISSDVVAFPENFRRFWEVIPENGLTIIAVDPTPPPKNPNSPINMKLDDAAIVVLRLFRKAVYVCETYDTKSPDTAELFAKIFEFAFKWHARDVYIETVLFARVIASALDTEMLNRRLWLTVHRVEDPRPKAIRIIQNISPLYTTNSIYFHHSQGKLIEQLNSYPKVNKDDLVDALSIGLQGLSGWLKDPTLGGEGETLEGDFIRLPDEDEIRTTEWRRAP